MRENSLEIENILDPGVASWLAEDSGAQALVLGKIERDAGNVNISATSYGVKDGEEIANFAIAIPLTDQMKGLIPILSKPSLRRNSYLQRDVYFDWFASMQRY